MAALTLQIVNKKDVEKLESYIATYFKHKSNALLILKRGIL